MEQRRNVLLPGASQGAKDATAIAEHARQKKLQVGQTKWAAQD